MNKYIQSSFAVVLIIFSACTGGQPQEEESSLSPTDFAGRIKELPSAAIIDVRTAEEFGKGHLLNAVNVDWNGVEFDNRISIYDKSTPVFVYCLSGGRSSDAAKHMRAAGFKQVYELKGGIMKWRNADLPETTGDRGTIKGISKERFDDLMSSDKLVLIDFYADWCGPCKLMKPYLDEISAIMENKVVVIRINTDDNPALCKQLGVDAIPVLRLYKNKLLTWSNEGYLNKEEILKHLQ